MSKHHAERNNDAIVITCFGAVTPIGGTYEHIAHALYHGISGIKKIHKFATDTFVTAHAGVPDEGNDKIKWPSSKRLYTENLYAELAATRLAAHDNFPINYYPDNRIGCIVGVDEPSADIQLCLNMKAGHENDLSRISTLNKMISHFRLSDCLNLEPTAVLSSIYNIIPFKNYASTHVGLCSASLQAIGMGVNALRQGHLDAAIVGGVSGKVNPFNLARLELMNVISTNTNLTPEERSRPFDEQRSGFVLAEGAVLFLIEKESNVRLRSGKTLMRILGYGASLGAEHIVIPHKESKEMKLSMARALNDAQLSANQIDLINAHATSTVLNEIHESMAINDIFATNPKVPVTANKSLHGHLIAAAGAMEVLNSLITLEQQFIPGSININSLDKHCNVNVIRKTQPANIKRILKNSFGMGGLAASMVLERGVL